MPRVATQYGVIFNPGNNFDWVKNQLLKFIRKCLNRPYPDSKLDWNWDGDFHYTNSISELIVDGQNINITNQRGFDAT